MPISGGAKIPNSRSVLLIFYFACFLYIFKQIIQYLVKYVLIFSDINISVFVYVLFWKE